MAKVRRALISVHDKSGVVDFAKGLCSMGVEIISTGGTAKLLAKEGVPVVEISGYTGSPEILDGRLKTLHPKVHGGLLGRRDVASHARQMEENGILPIDLLVVNLYPFEATVARQDATFEDAIENIDIGGPAMIRAASKNFQDVAVVVEPADYPAVLGEISASGEVSKETKFALARKSFAATARYDAAIATHLNSLDGAHARIDMPDRMGFMLEKVQDLRYGENPHQKAAFYRCLPRTEAASIANAVQLQGKELSYNNIMDSDATLAMTLELARFPYAAVIVKHNNPCGAAVSGSSLSDAFRNALECDPVSAFGGIIGFAKELDAATANAISEIFFEVIIAPSFSDEARQILGKKKNLRLLVVPNMDLALSSALELRGVAGGVLIQGADISGDEVKNARPVTKRAPTADEMRAMEFAWRICKYVKSNAIVFADRDRTIGIGAGQTSRVDSANIAVMKARSSLAGSVVASDAFFPFRDGIDVAAKAGATAVVQPGGSMRDEEAIAAADEHGMAMIFTGIRHFRH